MASLVRPRFGRRGLVCALAVALLASLLAVVPVPVLSGAGLGVFEAGAQSAGPAGASSYGTAFLHRTVIEEGQTRQFQISGLPARRAYYVFFKPLAAPYTAEAGDVSFRVPDERGVLAEVAAGSGARGWKEFLSGRIDFVVEAHSDADSDDETFGVRLCTTVNCQGGTVLGDWTVTVDDVSDTTVTGTGVSVTVSGGHTTVMERSLNTDSRDRRDDIEITLAAAPTEDIVILGKVDTQVRTGGADDDPVMEAIARPNGSPGSGDITDNPGDWFFVARFDNMVGGQTAAGEYLTRKVELVAQDNVVDSGDLSGTWSFRVVTVADADEDDGDSTDYQDNDAYSAVSLPSLPVTVTGDDEPTEVFIEKADTADNIAVEGDTTDTAKFKVRLSRALEAGEWIEVPLASRGADLGTHFTLALDGAPQGVTYAASADGMLGLVTFTGPSAVEATVVVTAASDDGNGVTENVLVHTYRTSEPSQRLRIDTNLDAVCSGEGCGPGRYGERVYRITLQEASDGLRIIDHGDRRVVEAPDDGTSTYEYEVRLNTAPANDVVVTVTTSDTARTQIASDKTTLTFTPSNWDTAQTMRVFATRNNTDEADRPFTVTHAFSGDATYAALADVTHDLVFADNDATTVTMTGTGVRTSSSGTEISEVMVEGDASRVDRSLTVSLSRALEAGEYVRVPLYLEAVGHSLNPDTTPCDLTDTADFPDNADKLPADLIEACNVVDSVRGPRYSANVAWPPHYNDFDMAASGIGVSVEAVNRRTPPHAGFRWLEFRGAGAQAATIELNARDGFDDGEPFDEQFYIKFPNNLVVLPVHAWAGRRHLNPDTNLSGGIQRAQSNVQAWYGITDDEEGPAGSVPEVPADWPLVPAGLNPGDSFRLIYVTSQTTTAQNGNLAVYDAFVRAEITGNDLVNGGVAALADHAGHFKAIAETVGTTARDHAQFSPDDGEHPDVPVYWVGGAKVADDNADFADGTWGDEANPKHADGTAATINAGGYWTGSGSGGVGITMCDEVSLGQRSTPLPRLGEDDATVGLLNNSGQDGFPLGPRTGISSQCGRQHGYSHDPTGQRPMYALSGEFTVAPEGAGIESAAAAEGSAVTFAVTIPDAAPAGGITVPYSLSDGRGIAGELAYTVATGASGGTAADYDSDAGSVVIAQGQTTNTFTVSTTQDSVYEGDHFFTVTLGVPTGANAPGVHPAKGTAIGTITDAADLPTLAFSSAAVSAGEGDGTVDVTVARTGTTLVPSSVFWTTADGTAAHPGDYTAQSGTVEFAAGDTSKTLTVGLVDDDTAEGAETFKIQLDDSEATAAQLGGTAETTVTVTDDDGGGTKAALVFVDAEADELAVSEESGHTDTYEVELSKAPSADVTVAITAAAGAAVNPASLTFTTTNWGAGQEVEVSGVDDNTVNAGGARLVTISHATSSPDSDFNALTGDVTVRVVDTDTTPTLAITPAQVQSSAFDSGGTVTLTLTPEHVTFLRPFDRGGDDGGGGDGDGAGETDGDDLVNGASLTAAGLALLTFTGAPSGLTVDSAELGAVMSDVHGQPKHRSLEVVLSYSGSAITADDTVTLNVDKQLLRRSLSAKQARRYGASLSADFTIKPPGPVTVSMAASDGDAYGNAVEGASNTTGYRTVTVTLGRTLTGSEKVTVPLSVVGATVTDDFTFGLEPATQTGVSLTTTGGTHTAQNPAVVFAAGASSATLRLKPADNSVRSEPYVVVDFGTGTRAPSASGATLGTVSGDPVGVVFVDDETGDFEVAADWPLLPSGLSGGDEFRLMFLTSQTRSATVTDIGVYNEWAQGVVAASGHAGLKPYGSLARVVGSTTVDARVNTGMHTGSAWADGSTNATGSGVAVYWLAAPPTGKVADNYFDFYDGDWDGGADQSGADTVESGAARTATTAFWTGSNNDGTNGGTRGRLGRTRPYGASVASGNPLSDVSTAQSHVERPMLVMSPVFKVEATAGAPVTVAMSASDGDGDGNAVEGGAGTTGYRTVTITLGRALTASEEVTVPLTVVGATVTDDYTFALNGTNTGVTLNTSGSNSAQDPAVVFSSGAQSATLRLAPVDNNVRTQPYVIVGYGTGARAPAASGGVTLGAVSGGPVGVVLVDDESGDVVLPAGADFRPAVSADAEYRLLFMTSVGGSASSTDIADYDHFVRSAAVRNGGADLLPFAGFFRAFVSTASVDGREHVGIWDPALRGGSGGYADGTASNNDTGTPIYWLGASSGRVMLSYWNFCRRNQWFGRWTASENLLRHEDGSVGDGAKVWTGMNNDCTTSSSPLGTATPTYGPGTQAGRPLSIGTEAAGSVNRFYAVSEVFKSVASADMPQVAFARTSYSASEGGAASVTLSVSPAPTADLTVRLVAEESGSGAGSATAGEDFTAGGFTVTVPAGQTSVSVDVATFEDDVFEDAEAFRVILAASPGYLFGGVRSAIVTVTDDDILKVGFAQDEYWAPEDGGSFDVELSLDRDAEHAVSLTLAFGGTATGGSDYTAPAASVTIPAGNTSRTHTVTIPILADSTVEPDETIVVTISAVTTTRAQKADRSETTVFIADQDRTAPGLVVPDTVEVDEGRAATYRLRLATAPTGTVTVTVSGHTATVLTLDADDETAGDQSSVDFTASNWYIGRRITVRGVHDQDLADDPVSLAHSASGADYGSVTDSVSATVDDEDVTLSIAGGSAVTEGAAAEFTVTASSPPDRDLTVNVGIADAAGADFVAAGQQGNRTRTLRSGQSTATFTVPTVADLIIEPSGPITIALRASDSYRIDSSAASAEVQVNDDDTAPVAITMSASDGNPDGDAVEGAGDDTGYRTITLTLERVLTDSEMLTVPLSVTGATVTDDYTFGLAPLTQTGVSLDTSGPHSAQTPAVVFAAGATTATLRLTPVDNSVRSQRYVVVDFGAGATAGGGINVGAQTGGPIGVVFVDNESGPIEVPAGWALAPSGLSGGDEFRLIFVTSQTRTAESADIDDYNRWAQSVVAAGGHADLLPYSGLVSVIASTATVGARENTAMWDPTLNSNAGGYTDTSASASDSGTKIYWIAAPPANKTADNYHDFFDASWDTGNNNASQATVESGASFTGPGAFWTGTSDSGVAISGRALGASNPRRGSMNGGTNTPLDTLVTAANTASFPLLAVSPVFTMEAGPEVTVTMTASRDSAVEGANDSTGYSDITITLGRALTGSEIVRVPLSVAGATVGSSNDFTFGLEPSSQTGVSLRRSGQPGISAQNPVIVFSSGGRTATLRLKPVDNGVRSQRYAVVDFGTQDGGTRSSGSPTVTLGTPTGGPIGVVFADDETGDIEVASDWALAPSGLSAGDEFRLLYITSQTRNAESTDIGDYNAFVRRVTAEGGHADLKPYAGLAAVVGSTAATDARENTAMWDPTANSNAGGHSDGSTSDTDSGVEIYWIAAPPTHKIADNYFDFYDGSWDTGADNRGEAADEAGTTISAGIGPFTGANDAGTSHSGFALGDSTATIGNVHSSGNTPLDDGLASLKADILPFLAMSPVFKVAAATTGPEVSVRLMVGEGENRNADGEVEKPESDATVSFPVSLDTQPATDMTVCVSVAESGDVDRVAMADEGIKTVSFLAGVQTGSIDVAWTDTAGDDLDSVITVTAVPSSTVGCTSSDVYTVSGAHGSEKVRVTDDEATEVTLTSSDTQMTEQDASDAATLTVSSGRALVAGESLVARITLATSTMARLPGHATPDFAVTATGTGVVLTGAATTTPLVTFTGSDDGTVQTATVTLTPTAADDADTADETVTAALSLITGTGSGTVVTGGGVEVGSSSTATLTIDDDDTSNCAAQNTVLSVSDLRVTEMGGVATYCVRLTTAPSGGDTTVAVGEAAGRAVFDPSTFTVIESVSSGAATVSPSSLTFTASNWTEPQQVTVTATDEAGDNRNRRFNLTHTASGGGYSSQALGAVAVLVTDAPELEVFEYRRTYDEAAYNAHKRAHDGWGIFRPNTLTSTPGLGPAPDITPGEVLDYFVRLSAQPAGEVEVTINVTDIAGYDADTFTGISFTRGGAPQQSLTFTFHDGDPTAAGCSDGGKGGDRYTQTRISWKCYRVIWVHNTRGLYVEGTRCADVVHSATGGGFRTATVPTMRAFSIGNVYANWPKEFEVSVYEHTNGTRYRLVYLTKQTPGGPYTWHMHQLPHVSGTPTVIVDPSSFKTHYTRTGELHWPSDCPLLRRQYTNQHTPQNSPSQGGPLAAEAPPEPTTPVANLTLTAAGGATVDVAWDAVIHADKYLVAYSAQSADGTAQSAGVHDGITTTSYTLDHGIAAPATVTVTVTPGYDTDAGTAVYIDSLAATATLDTGSTTPSVVPEITITASTDVTEGGDATFTITASPAPAAGLDVIVEVNQSGDFASTGTQTVTIPTSGTYTLVVATTNDDTDEADGTITATVNVGAGYSVSGAAAAATVAVSDNDPPPDCVSDKTLELARDYYELNRHRAPGYGRNWRRVLIAFGDITDTQLEAFTAAEARQSETRWAGWRPFRQALECIEQAQQDPAPPPAEPEIAITAGNDVTEGDDATFTITAAPAPAAGLDITVEVAQTGDFAATGTQTVTIPTSGAYTLVVATTNDSADEPDGSVTATIEDGTGYTVSSSNGAATVNVSDDDDPPPPATPEISIAAGTDVTEGGDAVFTITADPAPHTDLDVAVEITQSGAFVSTGVRTVTIGTTGTATLTVAATDDSTDEADGTITATVDTGTGYTVSSTDGAATVNVSDDDIPEIAITAGADVTEGGNATFTITASPTPHAALDVTVTVSQTGDHGATSGSRTVTVPANGTYTLVVATSDDNTDEEDGSVTATVSTGTGYTISSSSGNATVAVADNDDPPPADEPEDNTAPAEDPPADDPAPTGPPTISVSDATAQEGDPGGLRFTVTVSPVSDQAITLGYGAFGRSAASGSDFTIPYKTFTLNPGDTELQIVVPVTDDTETEPDETLTLYVYAASGITIPGYFLYATGTIADND